MKDKILNVSVAENATSPFNRSIYGGVTISDPVDFGPLITDHVDIGPSNITLACDDFYTVVWG